MKIAGVLFDKDGTLIDFERVWGKAATPVVRQLLIDGGVKDNEENINTILECLGVHDGKINPDGPLAWMPYPKIASHLLPTLTDLGWNFKSCVINMKKDKTKDSLEKTAKLADRLAVLLENQIFDENNIIETTGDLLTVMEFLKSCDINVGIVTTDVYDATIKTLQRLDILQYFSFFAADKMPISMSMPHKPDGRIIKQAADYWGCNASQILVVGDTPNDMRFANNGNAIAVGVLSGTGDKRSLEPLAYKVIDSVDELPRLIHDI